MRTLIGTFSANGPSDAIPINKTAMVHIGPADGGDTFAGGIVSLEMKAADNQWYASGITLDASNVKRVTVDFPKEIRLSIAGATSPDLDYVIESDRP